MSDGLEELRRRAYGRPLSEADAAEAQAELRQLADSPEHDGDRDAPSLPPARVPAVASVPARGKLLLGAGALVAAALATGIALAPAPSLDVFATPQHGVPTWPGAPADDDNIRWLGSLGPWDVFGLITSGGNVCVTAFAGADSAGGSCTSRAEFGVSGLELGTSSATVPGALSVQWGPRGEARLYDVPLTQLDADGR